VKDGSRQEIVLVFLTRSLEVAVRVKGVGKIPRPALGEMPHPPVSGVKVGFPARKRRPASVLHAREATRMPFFRVFSP